MFDCPPENKYHKKEVEENTIAFKLTLEPQGQPLKNGWIFGDFQPFPM